MVANDLIRRALESDEELKTAVEQICTDSNVKCIPKMVGEAGMPDGPELEYMQEQARELAQAYAQYAIEYSGHLYAQLNLFLSNTNEWIWRRAGEIGESKQAGEHIAALPYLAHKVHTPDSDELPRLIEEKMDSLRGFSGKEIVAALKKFWGTAMTGMFAAGEEESIPCLNDEQTARLGVLLGVEAYCRSVDRDDRMFDRVHPNVSLDAMMVWGFAMAELMCSASSEKKDRFYAWNVSNMVCARLSDNIDFDEWANLRESMDSMCEIAQDFYGILKEMTQGIDPQPGKHILVPKARERDRGGEIWLEALAAMTSGGHEAGRHSSGTDNKKNSQDVDA